VADRFHVIRLVNHHFLNLWKQLDPIGAKETRAGVVDAPAANHLSEEQAPKLQRYLHDHPALNAHYQFKQQLCRLLLERHKTARQCRRMAPHLLRRIESTPNLGLGSTGQPRRDFAFLVRRDCPHVAIEPQQRHHRRFSHQNGGPTEAGLRLSQLQQLSLTG
jgi:hypothetical protein